jgi:hypothetical protein
MPFTSKGVRGSFGQFGRGGYTGTGVSQFKQNMANFRSQGGVSSFKRLFTSAKPEVITESNTSLEQETAPLKQLGDGGVQERIESGRLLPEKSSVGNLKPTELEIAINEEHIFNGEIRPNGKAVGFHYEGIESTSSSRSTTILRPTNADGVYQSRVEIFNNQTNSLQPKMMNPTTSGRSTFFPKHWTKAEVLAEIRGAFANQTEPMQGDIFIGEGPKGLKIKGIVRADGVIETAYPYDEP